MKMYTTGSGPLERRDQTTKRIQLGIQHRTNSRYSLFCILFAFRALFCLCFPCPFYLRATNAIIGFIAELFINLIYDSEQCLKSSRIFAGLVWWTSRTSEPGGFKH